MSDLEALRAEIEKALHLARYDTKLGLHEILSAVFPVVERFVSSLPQDPNQKYAATADGPETFEYGYITNLDGPDYALSEGSLEHVQAEIEKFSLKDYGGRLARRTPATGTPPGSWEPMP